VIIEGNRFGQIGEGLKRGPANAVVFINVAGSRIGGSSAGARNLFVGSKNAAVICIGTETTENDIVGNWFGLSEGGNAVSYLHFNGYGIGLAAGAHHNRIGGPSAGSRNVISGSDDAGICFSTGAHDNTIEGNWIGLDASGTSPADNGAGIWIIAGFNNRIGGSGTGQRNILSGNRVSAIRLGRVVGQPFKDPLLDPGAGLCAGTYIEGNWIGLDHSGTRAVPNGRSFNGGSAVDIARFATGTIIGGDTPERRNVISGNAGSAIVVDATVETAHGVFGNRIGTSVDGLSALPNQGAGLSVIGERAVVVGGIGEGQQNQIAYNRGPGVSLIKLKGGMPGVELEGNLIHDNDPAGSIALANARSSNDAGDADTGPNGRQNWPLLLAAANLNGVTAVAFDLSSFARGIPVRVDVFSASGGGGKTLLGTTTVTTGADPEDRYVVSAALQFVGSSITALATTTDGTSEFSSPIKVVSGQDSDGDGLPDALEREVPITPGPGGAAPLSLYQTAGAGSPSSGDRNADGIADETQANVASVQIPDDGEWITVATTAGRTLTDVVGLRGMDVAALPDSQQVQPGAVRFTLGGATGSAEPLALWLPPQPATPTVWRLNGPAWSEITGLQVQPIGALWKVSFTLPVAPMGSDWLLGVGQPVTPLPAPVLTLLPPELQTLERPSTDSPVSLTYDAPVVEPPPQGWVRSLTIVLPAGAANWTLQTSSDLSLWENLPLAPALGATVVTLAYPVNEPARFFRWRQP
jgi:hypothetical protein